MANLVGAANWDKFKNLIKSAHDTFFQDTIVWRKSSLVITPFNEDDRYEYVDIPLKCLIQYNFFRTWPSTKRGIAGEIDDTNSALLLSMAYLQENGWINADGYFDFSPDSDYFIHKGITYKGEGDTPVSQAYDEAQIFQIVLKRQETET